MIEVLNRSAGPGVVILYSQVISVVHPASFQLIDLIYLRVRSFHHRSPLATTTMEKLPAEVVDEICEWLADDRPSSKNLRLVARRFSRTVKNIFHTLILYQHPEKWQNVNKIAAIPALAAQVHTVKLVRQAPFPFYGSLYEFQARAGTLCPKGDDELYRNGSLSAAGLRSLMSAYASYQYWSEGYARLEGWVRKRLSPTPYNAIHPVLQLDKLKNFHHIQTIGHKDLCLLNNDSQQCSHTSCIATRQEAESQTCLPGYSGWTSGQDSVHLELFILACSQSGKQVSSLALHNINELLEGAHAYGRVSGVTPQKLEVDLNRMTSMSLQFAAETFNLYFPNWKVAEAPIRALNLAENIKSSWGFDLVTLLGPTAFPELKTLTLKYARTPDVTLREFLRHHPGLTSLTIEEPLMLNCRWEGLRQDIMAGARGLAFLAHQGTRLHLTDSHPSMYDWCQTRMPFDPAFDTHLATCTKHPSN